MIRLYPNACRQWLDTGRELRCTSAPLKHTQEEKKKKCLGGDTEQGEEVWPIICSTEWSETRSRKSKGPNPGALLFLRPCNKKGIRKTQRRPKPRSYSCCIFPEHLFDRALVSVSEWPRLLYRQNFMCIKTAWCGHPKILCVCGNWEYWHRSALFWGKKWDFWKLDSENWLTCFFVTKL